MTADSLRLDAQHQRLVRERFSIWLCLIVLRTSLFTAAIAPFLVLGGSAALWDLDAGGGPRVPGASP